MPGPEPKGDAGVKKYRLRVDVAKPAELYTPTFGSSKMSPAGASIKTPLAPVPAAPLAPDDSDRRPIDPAVLRALEGGKRNRKPVDRMPAGGDAAAAAAAAAAGSSDKGSDSNGGRVIQRILSRRVHEGGSTSYLVVWGNGHVTSATWHSRASLGAFSFPFPPPPRWREPPPAAATTTPPTSLRALCASSLTTLALSPCHPHSAAIPPAATPSAGRRFVPAAVFQYQLCFVI